MLLESFLKHLIFIWRWGCRFQVVIGHDIGMRARLSFFRLQLIVKGRLDFDLVFWISSDMIGMITGFFLIEMMGGMKMSVVLTISLDPSSEPSSMRMTGHGAQGNEKDVC